MEYRIMAEDTKNRSIFVGMQILEENKWLKDYALVVEDKRIKAIVPINMVNHHLPAKVHHYPNDYYLVPGFIDLHVHGAHGKDVMDADEESLVSLCHALAAEGTTGFLATTMTASDEQIERVLSVIANAMHIQKGARILGVHLEGPFIAKIKMGAQSGRIKDPDLSLFQKWQNLAQNSIKIVTLAPELPGALQFIKSLRKMDVIVSIGHTNATYEETLLAIAAGCSQATHIFNAMRGLHQREPGAVGAVLLSDIVRAELIVDGVHLHPAIVDLIYHLKHKDRLLLITDSMRAKYLQNGKYELGGQMVDVKDGIAALSDGTLAGSTLCMPVAIKNIIQFTHCSLNDAFEMASLIPARVLGINDRKGSIAVGKDADLVVLDPGYKVMMTMREGQIVFSL